MSIRNRFTCIALWCVAICLLANCGGATSASPPVTYPSRPRNDHVGISVAKLDAAQNWYQEAFGLRQIQQFQLPELRVRTVLLEGPTGLRVELIERSGSARLRQFSDPLDATLVQGYGHWALQVVDLDRTFSGLLARGAKGVSPPAPAVKPGDRFAYVKDPEGNLIELIESPLH